MGRNSLFAELPSACVSGLVNHLCSAAFNTICNAQALHLHRTSRPSAIIPPSPLTNTLATAAALQLTSAQPAGAARSSNGSLTNLSTNNATTSARPLPTPPLSWAQHATETHTESLQYTAKQRTTHPYVRCATQPRTSPTCFRSSDQPLVPVRASEGLVRLNGTADHQRQTVSKAAPTKCRPFNVILFTSARSLPPQSQAGRRRMMVGAHQCSTKPASPLISPLINIT